MNDDDFEVIAVARDLARKPEIKLLAKMLYDIYHPGPDDADDMPPLYVMLAYRLAARKENRDMLRRVLEIFE